ncbi:hypothetical protein [Saccharopolyspora hordei]|uniref:Uncharacterized protein n=1 Tax=Saccharopolyspora hordei TaxID=1838 RepID=A0A853ARH5_9PSEU|nr:hypothetical protein [Saccharopolyspora hordei]NYI84010.1 hypothetical protein [Saccharopolyspora hordei]
MGAETRTTSDHDEIPQWFEKCDAEGLELLCQLKKSDGADSTSHTTVSRD